MTGVIVDETGPVTLIGCGKLGKTVLNKALALAPVVVAADGAARRALRRGIVPQAVIGDFDSIGAKIRAAIPADRLHPIPEQDSTDFDKCLRSIRAPLVIGVGFGGGRVDHQLAVYHSLLRHPGRPCLLLSKRDLVFLAPPELSLSLPVGSRVSLFPLVPIAAQSSGLRWPLDGIGFAPGQRIGTSNEVADRAVRLRVDEPGMLVILPASALAEAVRGLAGPGARWRVP